MNRNKENIELTVFIEDADKYFGRIDPNMSNGQLLKQTINMPGISSFIVETLKKIEHTEESFYEALEDWFHGQIQSEKIVAPIDPVDKHRWLALICIAASKKEGFSHGNIVIAPDYLPEDSKEFEEYESTYGFGVMDDIRATRRSIE